MDCCRFGHRKWRHVVSTTRFYRAVAARLGVIDCARPTGVRRHTVPSFPKSPMYRRRRRCDRRRRRPLDSLSDQNIRRCRHIRRRSSSATHRPVPASLRWRDRELVPAARRLCRSWPVSPFGLHGQHRNAVVSRQLVATRRKQRDHAVMFAQVAGGCLFTAESNDQAAADVGLIRVSRQNTAQHLVLDPVVLEGASRWYASPRRLHRRSANVSFAADRIG